MRLAKLGKLWILALVTCVEVLHSQPAPELLGTNYYFSGTLLEDELRLNQRALEVGDHSRQALIWVDRAMLYARATDMGEARRALAAARAMASLVSPYMEAQVLLQSGSRLLAIELLEDAAAEFEEVARLLDRQGQGAKGLWTLRFVYSNLFQIYGRLGLDEMKSRVKAKLVPLADQIDVYDLQGLLEFLEKSESFSESDSEENDIDHMMHSMKLYVERFRDSPYPENRRRARFLDAFLQLIEIIDRGEDIWEFIGRVKKLNDDPQLILALNVAAPLFKAMKEGSSSEILSVLGNFMELFPPDLFSSRLLQARMLMLKAVGDGLLSDWPSEESVARCKEAIERFDAYVGDMRVEEARTGFIDDEGYRFYRFAVEILARVSKEDSFTYAERGRAWSLRRLLGNPRETTLEGPVSETERLWYKITNPKDGLAPVDPIDLGRLQSEVLPPDATLVSYFPGLRAPGLPQLRIWAVDRDRIEVATTLMSEEKWQEIACLIQALRWHESPSRAQQAAENRGVRVLSECIDLLDDPGGALHRRLIAPIARHLRHRRLIVVPHGLLHRVPFAALRNPETGRYLLKDHIVSMAPSTTALSILSERRSRDGGKALVIGDPKLDDSDLVSLTGAREEALTVARLLGGQALVGGKALLGEDATESAVRGNAQHIRVLHVAAHGQYDQENPRASRVFLSKDEEHDGGLEAGEILDQLEFGEAELVVLSGCETAVAEVSRGDDFLGLTYAFLVAGSRAVVATLWPVEDKASSQLMNAFYRGYIVDGRPAAEALRAAQLEMLAQEPTASPYYWAGFTLIGDPDSRWRPTPDQL